MKKLLSLLLAVTMLLALTACGGAKDDAKPTEAPAAEGGEAEAPAEGGEEAEAPAEGGEEAEAPADAVTLVMAEVNPIDSIIGQVDSAFKDKVEELSGGSIKIDIQAGGVLGAEENVLDSVMSGSNQIDIARISVFALNSYGVQKTVFCTLPFVFESPEHFWNFADSDLAKEFLNEPQELGLPVRGLFFGEEGFRHFFTRTDKPIESMDDLKGLKLRVSNDPIMNGLVESLGASPTVVSFNELYSGLQTGVCDGAEQPIGNYQSNAFNEVAPYLILDGHTLGAIQVIITDNAWNKLSEEQQGWIMEAAEYAQDFNKEIVDSAEATALQELKDAGVTVIEVEDKAPLVEAVSGVLEPYTTGDMGEIYEQIMAMK